MENWKKNFFMVASGQSTSLILSSAVEFAIIWWIAETTGSAVMMGISGFVAFLPSIIISPIAGVIADKYNRKWVCIVADMFMGVCALVFAILLYIYDLPVWIAFVILFFRAIGDSFHRPSLQALFPQIVPESEIMRIGGWNQMVASGAFLIGPVLGALLYASIPFYIVLLSDLLGAIIASTMMIFVKVEKLNVHRDSNSSTFSEFVEGLEVFRQDKKLMVIMAVCSIIFIFSMPLSSLYPLIISDYFKGNAWQASIVEIASASGMMISAFVFSFLKIRDKIRMSYIGLIIMGISISIGGILPNSEYGWICFTIVCVLIGISGNINGIPLVAYMQTNIPAEKLGRAFSIYELSASIAMPIGLIIASPIAESIGVTSWFFISGILMILIAFIGMSVDRLVSQKLE